MVSTSILVILSLAGQLHSSPVEIKTVHEADSPTPLDHYGVRKTIVHSFISWWKHSKKTANITCFISIALLEHRHAILLQMDTGMFKDVYSRILWVSNLFSKILCRQLN